MDFEEWMHSQNLSESTIRKYAGAIDGVLNVWGNDVGHSPKRIREIQDEHEFAAFSELIESTEIFNARNERGNSMYSAALNCYRRYLAYLKSDATVGMAGPHGHELAVIQAEEASRPPFDPVGQHDGRQRVLREIVRRQGQLKFRSDLMKAYDFRCAFSGCGVTAVLEAAHITPYLGPETNTVSNGLLLRGDLHTLWDLGLIAINPSTMRLALNPLVDDANYVALDGQAVFQPATRTERPSPAALLQQWNIFTNAPDEPLSATTATQTRRVFKIRKS